MPRGYFVYRGERHELQIDRIGIFVLKCPGCGEPRRLSPSRFRVFVSDDGRATITCLRPGRPSIACPDAEECRWYAEVTNGRAYDLEKPISEAASRFRSRLKPMRGARLSIAIDPRPREPEKMPGL